MRRSTLAPPPRLGWLLALLLAFGLTLPAASQTTGKLRGKVVDTETGEAVAGALLRVKNGGAPVTAEYAASIGADGYAPDAASAVEVAKTAVGMA